MQEYRILHLTLHCLYFLHVNDFRNGNCEVDVLMGAIMFLQIFRIWHEAVVFVTYVQAAIEARSTLETCARACRDVRSVVPGHGLVHAVW